MEEDSSKKNTDCVYFLASPLTCKKGVQCEFRHSEIARLNPRDCWFWISGNCLNDDCPFRHPPLDGVEGEPEVIPETTKGRVPCYYYFQGYCARGDKCSFMHGYPRFYDQAQDQAAAAQNAAPITEPVDTEAPKNVASVSLNEAQFVVTNEEKHVEALVDCISPKEVSYEYAQHSLQEGDVENSEEIVVDSDFDSHRRLRHDDSLHSMVGGGEWAKESSPGFDVLVGAGAEQALYCQDANYVCDHDAVLDPGNGGPLIVDGHVRGFHRVGDVGPDYTYTCSYEGNLHNRIRDDYRDYKVYDPPYHPSNPYDYLISSRQGIVDEQMIDATQRWREFEAALLARNLAVKRRRLEDRLVFPRRNRTLLSNRLKYVNRHNDEPVLHEQLSGHVVRSSGERAGVWFANSIHSRLGSRVSMKSRLQGRLRFANQRNARYLGIARHSRSKISKHNGGRPRLTETRIKQSEFAAPKTLAELKAAKVGSTKAAVQAHDQAEPHKLSSNTEAGKRRVITLNTPQSTDRLTSENKRDFEGPKPLCAILQEKCQHAGKGVAEQGSWKLIRPRIIKEGSNLEGLSHAMAKRVPCG